MHFDTTPHREHLSRVEAAAYLSLAPRTLARWAAQQRGPRYARSGPRRGRCWYAISDLDAWLEARKVSPQHGAPTT
jgi:hypothetical protein